MNAIPYLGKNTEISQREEAVPEYYFRLVTEPIYNSNRSVTCDNWYTSIPLLQRMLKDPFNLKITGTLRKNKRELPADFIVAPKIRPSTKFCHTQDLTLLSYAPKKKKSNKIVLVVSTFLHTEELTNEKPNIVMHYNATKGGTDNFDKLCHSYTVSGRTNRWPVRFFYGVLDQAIVNSRILLQCKRKMDGNEEKVTAIHCLDNVYVHLVTPYLEYRYTISTLRKDLRVGIASILKKDVATEKSLEHIELPQAMRCALCSRKEDRKTRKGCSSCHRPVCNEHSFPLCNDCVNN